MFIEDTTPIAALTVADLKKLLKDSLCGQKIDAIPPVTTPGKRYVYGLKGIQDLFGVCHLTAQRKIKKALELGYKPSSSVPFHSGVEQTEQLNN